MFDNQLLVQGEEHKGHDRIFMAYHACIVDCRISITNLKKRSGNLVIKELTKWELLKLKFKKELLSYLRSINVEKL